LRRLSESEITPSRTAPQAVPSSHTTGPTSRAPASNGRARTVTATSNVALAIRVWVTVIWVVAFVGALASGNWAFAVLALILGSLSGFWLSQALTARRSPSK
jgi:hypothetical protein